MAIYHLTAKTGSRGGGHSAGAKSDYINRDGPYSTMRDCVLYAASGHMPAWAAEPGAFWAAADVYERANGRLYKEIEFALPIELTLDQQRELVDAFVRVLTDERLPYSLAIHAGGGTNPHCHAMLSERVNDGVYRPSGKWFKRYNPKDPEKGGARKTEALKPKEWLAQTRELWADMANAALERAGHAARIDHRTLEAQGVERVPQIHLGPNVTAMTKKGIRTDRGDVSRSIDATNQGIQARRAVLDRECLEAWDDREELRAARAAEIEIDAFLEAQSARDAADAEAQYWYGTGPDGIPHSEQMHDLVEVERYGVSMLVSSGMVRVNTGQHQQRTERQLAAALYRQCRDQAEMNSWAAIRFFGIPAGAREHIEKMAIEDGWAHRIEFADDAPAPGAADDIDLDEEMNRLQQKPVSRPSGGSRV